MPVVINDFEVLAEPPAAPAVAAPAAEPAAVPPRAALEPLLEQWAREARQRAERVQEL
jgi:hypothetical protein